MSKIADLGTWIHGIAVTEDLDSSGERIKLSGVDVNSLVADGTFNWEHKSEEPNQTVGKIFEVKKIMSIDDCKNEHHKYFWKSAGEQPYIYVAGILFDKMNHPGAMAVSAMLRFDQLTDKKETKHIINFSIEGTRLDKKGVWINQCIARKVTLTHRACNKRCIAEILEKPNETKSLTKESLFNIFKKCEGVETDLVKQEGTSKYSTSLAFKTKTKESPRKSYVPMPPKSSGTKSAPPFIPTRTFQASSVGADKKLKAGDRITYGKKTSEPKAESSYKPTRTFEASSVSDKQTFRTGDRITHRSMKPQSGKELYADKPKDIEKKAPQGIDPDKHERCVMAVKEQGKDVGSAHAICSASLKKINKRLLKYRSNMHKALVASCGVGSAPEGKVGMDALAKESLDKEIKSVCKSLSNEAFNSFNKKEELRKFLEERLPNLGKHEITALMKAVAYTHLKKAERKLSHLMREYDTSKRALRGDVFYHQTKDQAKTWANPEEKARHLKRIKDFAATVKQKGQEKYKKDQEKTQQKPKKNKQSDMPPALPKDLAAKEKIQDNLNKGSLQQRQKFNPQTPANLKIRNKQREWTHDQDTDVRDNFPKMEGHAKDRAVRKLYGKTKVRRDSESGEPTFLMHRYMGPEEYKGSHAEGKTKYTAGERTSWTPHYNVASEFGQDPGSKVVSAWIPQSSLIHNPLQFNAPSKGKRPGSTQDRSITEREENEWIVQHDKDFSHADLNEVFPPIKTAIPKKPKFKLAASEKAVDNLMKKGKK